MAMVKLGNGVTDINGISGGDVFRYDQCGFHVQKQPRKPSYDPSKPTESQKAFRRAICLWASHKWTQDELNNWWNYCERHPMKNKKGETVFWHPMLAFLSVNIRRFLVELPLITDAPTT